MVHLDLPLATEQRPCADWTAQLGVRPWGTGLFLDRLVLVDLGEPWPKPAVSSALLAPIAAPLAHCSVRSRVVAVAPDRFSTPHAEFTIEVHERTAKGSTSFRWTANEPTTLHGLAAAIGSCEIGELDAVVVAGAQRETVNPDITELLLCTQGTHDLCCGTLGENLAASLTADGVRVRRVSHLGGHRFAPTLFALPSGRMWAQVDRDLAQRIAANEETADDLTTHCRGWWGASTGAAQVAEIMVRSLVESAQPGSRFVVDRVEPENRDGESGLIRVVGGSSDRHDRHEWIVRVEVERMVPTISCDTPGGLPTKYSAEYRAELVSSSSHSTEPKSDPHRQGANSD